MCSQLVRNMLLQNNITQTLSVSLQFLGLLMFVQLISLVFNNCTCYFIQVVELTMILRVALAIGPSTRCLSLFRLLEDTILRRRSAQSWPAVDFITIMFSFSLLTCKSNAPPTTFNQTLKCCGCVCQPKSHSTDILMHIIKWLQSIQI